jgi:glycosyltransferase involved in cell wall biosynthesis
MKIGWFWADLWREWISSMWRVQFPHTGLLRAGYNSKLASAWELTPDYITSKPTWNKETIAQFRNTLETWIDGIFVPSEGLSRELGRYGHLSQCMNKVHIIPNYPDLNFPAYEYALNASKMRSDDRYVVGWGGSHHHSIEQLVPVFKRLIKIEPLVQIWIVGNSRAFNLLEDIPMEHKRYFPAMPYGPYLVMIKQFDIFAIPLKGRYDYCRSWIKPLESALMGVPWVATHNRIYQKCKGGRLVRTKEQWKNALLSPIQADQEWALRQDITDHIGEYLEVFDD